MSEDCEAILKLLLIGLRNSRPASTVDEFRLKASTCIEQHAV